MITDVICMAFMNNKMFIWNKITNYMDITGIDSRISNINCILSCKSLTFFSLKVSDYKFKIVLMKIFISYLSKLYNGFVDKTASTYSRKSWLKTLLTTCISVSMTSLKTPSHSLVMYAICLKELNLKQRAQIDPNNFIQNFFK